MISTYGSMEGSSHEWVALRVPYDQYIAVANQFRIEQ